MRNIHEENSNSSISSNPFKWQISKQYEKLLNHFEAISEEEFKGIISRIKSEIHRIYQSEPEVFNESHKAMLSMMHETLKNHAYENVASREAFEDNAMSFEDVQSNYDTSSESGDDAWRNNYMRGHYRDDTSSEKSAEDMSTGYFSDSWVDHDSESESEDEKYMRWRDDVLQDFGDLDDVKNLISQFMDGPEGYSWLVNEYIEGTLEFSNDLIEKIDASKIGHPKEIISSALGALWFYLDWEQHDLYDELYIPKTFFSTLDKLKEGIIEDESKGMKDLLLDKLLKFKDQEISDARFHNLETKFNEAHAEQNNIEMQRLWSIYSKYRQVARSQGIRAEMDSDDDVSFSSVSTNVESLNKSAYLRKKLDKAIERADNYYNMKFYPHSDTSKIVYSSKKPSKVAKLNLVEAMTKVEKIGWELDKHKPGSQNVFVPSLFFVISDRPHEKGGDHKREFIEVPLDLDYSSRLLSKNSADGIFVGEKAGDQYFNNRAKSDIKAGTLLSSSSLTPTQVDQRVDCIFRGVSQQGINHSERVLFEALRSPQNVQRIVAILRNKIKMRFGTGEGGQFKIYTTLLIAYSTNSVCGNCAPSIIAMQNGFKDDFLGLLFDALNTQSDGQVNFRIRGFNPIQNRIDLGKFKVQTIVTAKVNFESQAHDLVDAGKHRHGAVKKPNEHHNPNAKLALLNDSIELNTLGSSKYFYEFVGVDFHTKVNIEYKKHSGVCFTSGQVSWQDKIPKGILVRPKIQNVVNNNSSMAL